MLIEQRSSLDDLSSSRPTNQPASKQLGSINSKALSTSILPDPNQPKKKRAQSGLVSRRTKRPETKEKDHGELAKDLVINQI